MSGPEELENEIQRLMLLKAQAVANDGPAFLRLLELAEKGDSDQVWRVVLFIAATYDPEAFPFDLFEVRLASDAITDDVPLCIDALRMGQPNLYSLVPDGYRRVQAIIHQSSLRWPCGSGPSLHQ